MAGTLLELSGTYIPLRNLTNTHETSTYISVPVWYWTDDHEKITRSISVETLSNDGYRQRFDRHKVVLEAIAYAFSMRPPDIASVSIHSESRRDPVTTFRPETIHELQNPHVTLEVVWK